MEEGLIKIKEKLEELLKMPSFFFEVPLNIYEKESIVDIVYYAKFGFYEECKGDKEKDIKFYRNLRNSKDERNKKIVQLLSRLLKEFEAKSQIL